MARLRRGRYRDGRRGNTRREKEQQPISSREKEQQQMKALESVAQQEQEEGEDLILPRFKKYEYFEMSGSLSYCPAGSLQVMVGNVESLGVSMRDDKWSQMFDFIKAHSIEGVDTVNMVVLNLPSGMPVNGVDDEQKSVPSWNMLTPSLIANGLLVGCKILSHDGFLACIHTYQQWRVVDDKASACGLERLRAFTLISSKPIYYEVQHPQTKIHTLIISLFHHRGKPTPKPYYSEAAELEILHGQCSLSRDLIVEKAEWVRTANGRGAAERSDTIWRFLLNSFSILGDTVVDLIAGTGTFIKIASQFGRHAFGLETIS